MKSLVFVVLLGALPLVAQSPELVLKSSSRVVQMEVFVNDSSGKPVHGLKKEDFVVTDNGSPREIRIFSGEVDANDGSSLPELSSLPPGVYSNRFGLRDARIATALVIDAVLRPEGLQTENNIFGGRLAATGRWPSIPPEGALKMALGNARGALNQIAPGEVMAIYAACPDLRVVQDFTSDPDQLRASLEGSAAPCAPKVARAREPRAIEELVPPMLSALREVAGRMVSASGRKSVVWLSQAYGTELNAATVQRETDAAIVAFNNADVPLYAVDTRFNPVCRVAPTEERQPGIVPLACTSEADASDGWMDWFARATGGRGFSGEENLIGSQFHDAQGRVTSGFAQGTRGYSLNDALLSAIDDSRYAYEIGFYVQDSELDGKLHMLGVKTPAKPKLGLRYRASYTASEEAMAPASDAARQSVELPKVDLQSANVVGIDASVAKVGGQLRVSLALDPATVGSSSIDATFTETDFSGKQLSRVSETVNPSSAVDPQEMIRFGRTVALAKGAVLLRISIRDQATGRVGALAVPVGK